jgi:hypothetical protein
LGQRAREFNDGTSWVGVPVPIDFEQLKNDCNVSSLKATPIVAPIVRRIVNLIMRCRQANPQRFQVEILPTEEGCTLD